MGWGWDGGCRGVGAVVYVRMTRGDVSGSWIIEKAYSVSVRVKGVGVSDFIS